MNPYFYLAGAIVLEVIATSLLKASEGMTRLGPTLGALAGYGVCFYLLSLTMKSIPTGIAYAIWSGVGIVLISAVGWLLYGRRITLRQGVAMAVSYAGMLLVLGHEVQFQGGWGAVGALLVFGSAVSYAIYLVYSGEMVQRIGSLRLVGLASSVACLLCILQFVLLRPLDAALVAHTVLWLSVLNAVACTVTPVLLVMMAIERIGAGLTAQTGMIGPLSTIAMGVVILGEPFNAWIIAGTVLVMGGVVLVTRGR